MSLPAPLDLGRMEAEAKENASKHISNLLQRPDQLEKVDQYKRRIMRKKASVDTMLKTAVQSQLDGVRTGLNQLQSALQDVYEIKQSLDEVEETYKSIQPIQNKLIQVNTENSRFCQLAAAMENLKHIFTVPESVRKTQELINEGKLLQAHKHLTDLESARDELMFELFKQPQQSPTDNSTLEKYFKDVVHLSESLGKQLWVIIQRTLSSVRREPTLIVTALRIVEREERMDVAVEERKQQSGFMPPGRPKKWRNKCFEILEDCISNKIEGNQLEDRDKNKMWLVRHLELTRQIMVDDLRVVVTMLPPIFPPDYNIVKTYVKMYHRALAGHLEEMIREGLEGNEFVTLLSWVNNYYSPDLMGHPDLNIDISELGPLLENNVIDELQNQYLRTMKFNIMEWMKNSLVQDKKDWFRVEHPDADGDGYYSTSLPVIIFQMMEQNLQVTRLISEDLVKKVLELFADELNLFSKDYIAEIESYKDRHLQDRSEIKFFLHYMIANINNSLSFGEYMKQLRNRYLKEDFEEDEENIRKDRFQKLNDTFLKIAKIGTRIIIEEVFIDLKNSKCLEEILTKNWLTGTHAVDIICATWADYSNDFVHLKPRFNGEVVEAGQKRVLIEFLKSLFTKKLQFKTYDERKAAAEKLIKEGSQLGELFQKYGTSKVGSEPTQNIFNVLPVLAEVLKLKDTSMISLEIMGVVKKYPDIRVEHLISLLVLRGDMNRADARQMVQDIVGEDDPLRPKPKGIFSELAMS
ncbi:exocyst complex component 3-like isoform X2 [Mytilus galloprovincialis]|uniref:exocyst complex component 3-like isoform X1 n=1 Tax=Mytilus galloprovincialis TaxID=29158 RepID=UPI003F7CA27B